MSRKPKRNNADLAAINDMAVTLVKRELQHYVDSPTERVPAALLSTASAILKAYSVPEEATAQEQAEEVATMTFKSRLAPQWVSDILGDDNAFGSIDDNDYVNIKKKAQYLAKSLDESNPERQRLEQVAREATARQAKEDASSSSSE